MEKMERTTHSPEETRAFAEEFARTLQGGETICLDGDLGVGKTVFVKGLAQGLEVEEEILSPTFTIVREYSGKLKLNHFDVYRIGEMDEMFYLGFDEYINSGGVTIIEWASLIQEIIPEHAIQIEIERRSDQDRLIRIYRQKEGRS